MLSDEVQWRAGEAVYDATPSAQSSRLANLAIPLTCLSGTQKTFTVKPARGSKGAMCKAKLQVEPCKPVCSQLALTTSRSSCFASINKAKDVLQLSSVGGRGKVTVTPKGPYPPGVSLVTVKVKYSSSVTVTEACNVTVVAAGGCP